MQLEMKNAKQQVNLTWSESHERQAQLLGRALFVQLTNLVHRSNVLIYHPKGIFTDKVPPIVVSFSLISLEKLKHNQISIDLEDSRQPHCLSGHRVLGLLWLLARAGILLIMKDRTHDIKENKSNIQVAVNIDQPLVLLVPNNIIRKDNLLWNQKLEL